MTNAVIAKTDKLGTRPVFWSVVGGKVKWSHTLDDFDAEPDRLGLFQALTIGFPIGRRSLLEGVRILPPGHELVQTPEGVREHEYWTPPRRLTHRSLSASAEAISVAFDSFCERLQGQSVALGLTGGKDSRVVLNALVRNKIRVTCLSWRDHDFNDRVAWQLAAVAKAPHFTVKAEDDELPALRDVTATATGGIYRYAVGFTLLGRECRRLGLSALLTGVSGDRLSGLVPRKDRDIKSLADRMLGKQMELYSFEEAEKMFGGNGRYTEQTIAEWRESFREQESRGDLGDVCLWQVLWNRNYKRIIPLLLPAAHYCNVVHPYLDDGILDCYLSLPVDHLRNQVAHCRAAWWGIPAFGELASTSFRVPLKYEPALMPVIDLLRELKGKMPGVARLFLKGAVSHDRKKELSKDVINRFCERHAAKLV